MNLAMIRAADSVYESTKAAINEIPTTDKERRLIAQWVVRRLVENMDRDYPKERQP